MPLSHHRLIAWQRADDLYINVHQLTRQAFPPSERFGLGDQLRQAAYSVPANIVEAFGRQHGGERLQFLHVAWGSLAETGYGLHAAHRLGYIDDGVFSSFDEQVRRTGAALVGLIKYQRRLMHMKPR